MRKIGKDVKGKELKPRKRPIISFRKVNVNMIISLKEVGIKHFFTGALAVNYYGSPRASMDVDVMVERNREKLKRLVKLLKRKGFDVTQRDVDEAFKESSHFSVFSRDSPYYFDFKVVPKSEENVFKRMRPILLYGKRTFLSSPEDLIINKISYGSDQDINDVRSIIKRHREKLDYNYLLKLAKMKNVLPRLQELLQK